MIKPKPIQASMFEMTVGEHLNAVPPPLLPPSATCKETVQAMRDHASKADGSPVTDCALIIDPQTDRIIGIITEADVVRRMAYLATAKTPIEKIMTRPVSTIESNDYLYSAIAAMHKSGLRHMPVVDGLGKPIGVLKLNDAMEAGTGNSFQRMQWMHPDGDDVEALREIKRRQPEFAAELLAEYVPVPHILGVISQMNNEIHRSVIDIALSEMVSPPPRAFAALILGSGGREENFLNPDQDNALIIDDYPDSEHDVIDIWFRQFSEKINEYLDEIGFPLCRGGVMTRNPVWRKTISQWCQQFEIWTGGMALSDSFVDIFFDFNFLHGERDLVGKLRDHISKVLKDRPDFLHSMVLEERLRDVVPLGWFNRVKTVTRFQDKEYAGCVNLKHGGLVILVQCLRRSCLQYGIMTPASHDRLLALQEEGFFSEDEATDIADAFDTLTRILLEHQIELYRKDLPFDNMVYYKSLSERQKTDLKRALICSRDMRRKMTETFTGRLL